MPKKKKIEENEISPINTKKINALSQMYANLPKSGFSKLVVTFCLLFSLIAIIASFVFLYFGTDASPILIPALGFFGSELLVLGATNIFNKEKTKDDIIFEQIRKEINDGNYYDQNGRVVYTETGKNSTNTTSGDTYIDNSVTNNYHSENEESQEENIELEQEQEVKPVFDASSIEVPSTQSQTEPKKRGRPKKVVKKEESKQEDDDTLEGESEWLDVDMSD